MKRKFLRLNSLSALLFALIACQPQASRAQPLFPNSVVSNDIDFIKPGDRGAFACLRYQGTSRQEMPHKNRNNLFAKGVHVYDARFKGGATVPIWAHPKIGSRDQIEPIVTDLAKALGELPSFMLGRLDHVVLNDGDETAQGEDAGRFFVVYHQNVLKRISTNDLQETVFHETVHATLDIPHASGTPWRAAQRADAAFVTDYAQSRPKREDLAETALFAWAMKIEPGRIGNNIEARLRETVPNRLAFFEALFAQSGFVGEMPATGSGC